MSSVTIADMGAALNFDAIEHAVALGFVALIGFALLWMAGRRLVTLAQGRADQARADAEDEWDYRQREYEFRDESW